MDSLKALADYLENHPAVREKAWIHESWNPAIESAGAIRLGDDCAAIPQPDGSHLLFAAEGMLESFVREDPWFAGYSAVMVNLSDVASMGGVPVGVTNVLGVSSEESASEIWQGMLAASKAYNVPIVGGHTTPTPDAPATLSAAVLGKAGPDLLTSFDAQAGDLLVMAIDLNGAYRGDKPFWNCSTTSTPEHLQKCLALLPSLAEGGLCCAAKDISNGGIIGTLAMFCETSQVGATLDLDSLPIPAGVPFERWLVSFPSYGYLLAVNQSNLNAVSEHFNQGHLVCESIGQFREQPGIAIERENESCELSLASSFS